MGQGHGTPPGNAEAPDRRMILEAATEALLDKGFEDLLLEDIAARLDVPVEQLAQAFSDKAEIAAEVLRPVLRRGIEVLDRFQMSGGRTAVEGVIEVYVDAWRRTPKALLLASRLRHPPIMAHLAGDHERFMGRMFMLLSRAGSENVLRVPDAGLAVQVLSRTAIALLEIYARHPRWEDLFRESMRGLLMR